MSSVVLITGASGGIGREAAIQCAAKGAHVAVHYGRNRDNAEQTLSQLSGDGHRLFQADISSPENTQTLIQSVVREMGALTVLVNNAGISQRQEISEIDFDTWQDCWQRIVTTNLTAAANLTFLACQHMKDNGGGRVVNVSSRGAFRGEPNMPWYGASKAGMNAMGQSMAQAFAPHNVYVYTVAPGFVETDMAAKVLASPEGQNIRSQSPAGRVAQPAELGNTISYLAMDAPAFMTGCIVDVNGASYLRS
ncbi:MAG: SDR family oxidoreductase [Pseudomonadota bacterium]